MKTFMSKSHSVVKSWYSVDATGLVLGRLAAKLAHILKGKHKATYTPHVDVGDYIVVTNVEKIKSTGNKLNDKIYYRYSGYPGGMKAKSQKKLLAENAAQVLQLAVQGMLPKNPLGRHMGKKLKIYEGAHHPHEAQKPIMLKL